MKEQKVYATVHYASGAKTDIVDEKVAANLRAWLSEHDAECYNFFKCGHGESVKEFINLNHVAFVKFHD